MMLSRTLLVNLNLKGRMSWLSHVRTGTYPHILWPKNRIVPLKWNQTISEISHLPISYVDFPSRELMDSKGSLSIFEENNHMNLNESYFQEETHWTIQPDKWLPSRTKTHREKIKTQTRFPFLFSFFWGCLKNKKKTTLKKTTASLSPQNASATQLVCKALLRGLRSSWSSKPLWAAESFGLPRPGLRDPSEATGILLKPKGLILRLGVPGLGWSEIVWAKDGPEFWLVKTSPL